MLNVCDPCLMVITRRPRALRAAVRRTARVVLPLCFRPITATIGGRRICLRKPEVIGRIHVHEEHGWIAMTRNDVVRDANDADVLEESDHTPVIRIEPALDSREACRSVERAQRLQSSSGPALRNSDIRTAR